jgi:prepilin-type N-terminal cleavage/methylation domain-containing protein
MSHVYPSSRGFTLLELMVVMVLLTLVTAFAMPGLRTSLFTDQLKATARQLVGLIAETGQEAVRSQAEQLLHIDQERNLVWVTAEVKKKPEGADTTSDTAAVWDNDPGKQWSRVTLPDAVKVIDIESVSGGKKSVGEMTIRFTTKGYVDKTLIHLRDDEGRDLTLILSPFLAVTRIVDAYVDIGDEKARY